MDARTAQAMIRFGLGRPLHGADPPDPLRWLESQVAPPPGDAAPMSPPAATIVEAFAAFILDRDEPNPPGQLNRQRQLFRTNMQAHTDFAIATDQPFRERLVGFWTNHFTVSLRRGEMDALTGDYVRSAIRPHVTGRFGDLLLAVMRHPAMLVYMDNFGSAGPASPQGLRQRRGLNENLARECLELHTCSPAAFYDQADVTEFARILTGWSVEREHAPVGFRFRPEMHDPGEKQVLGRTFPAGEQGGIDALAFLASHPMTHRHLAQKLVRHFVADDPPAAAVRVIEGVLRDTGGDLAAASLALLHLPQEWEPLVKHRSPWDLVLATLRASGLPPGQRPELVPVLTGLGQPPFSAPLPNGWPDTSADWIGPEAILRRVDWAYSFAGRASMPDPAALAETALGPLLSDATGAEIRRAGSRRDAIALLFASPEFQRR